MCLGVLPVCISEQGCQIDRKDTKQVLEVPGKKSQEEEPAASQSQQALCDEELPSERTKIPSASLMQLSKESLFLLDASKEGNVGRFLNVSIRVEITIFKHSFL